nr:hypothetical protein [Tanacetum cinerariifolium]
MDMTIDQQVALDEAIIPHTRRLRIGKSNFRLKSDISSKESTLQLAYDVMRLTPFYKAFLVTTDVPEIYIEIRRLTDVNINKLHQPWRSLAAIINKCLSEKSTGYDSLRLSQAQILWGLYHKRNVDFAYLLWEDFVYQVEHKDAKKSNKIDDQMFTTIKLVSRHQNTQQFGAMFPIELTNEDIETLKLIRSIMQLQQEPHHQRLKQVFWKTKCSSDTTITHSTAIAGTRLSTSAKGKQPAKASKAKSLTVLFEVAMTEAKQLKLAMKRSLQQTHISQASGSGVNEGTEDDDDVDEGSDDQDDDDDDQDEGDDDDDQEEVNDDDQDSDEEDEEFVHPKLSIHDKEETKDEESFDPIAKTPKNTADEVNDEDNLGIDSIFKTTSQMDVQAPTIVAPFPLSALTLTPLTIATISTVPQAPSPPTTAPSTLLQDLPNFGSLFGFDHQLKTLEANFSKFVQTNQFAGAVSFIPGIVQRYMDQRMNEAVKIIKEQVKEQVKVQISKILPKIEQFVNEQLKVEVLTRSSNLSKTSYAVAADLSEMELKKILIEKMEGNKSIHRSDEEKNLYKTLVVAYESNKIILDTYGVTVTLKRHRDDDADKDEKPSAGSDRGSKRRREGKETESTKEPMQTTHEMDEPLHTEFETGVADDQPIAETSQHPEWFSQQKKPPTPDRDWNKTMPATHRSIQPWISKLAKQSNSHSFFNELIDTPVDFSAFLMNRLKVDTLTLELLAGPTYELMKGSCKSLVELKFFLEEVHKATIDQLDWINPEGQQYLHNLLKPLPLIPNSRARRVISFDHFINNDLEYLRGGASSRKYTTSVTKTKTADYGHIKWIEDLVPRTMWIQESVGYDKHALWGISH